MAKNIVKRLTEQLQVKGMPEGKANAVAVKRMQAAGNVKAGSSELTPQGKKRSEMGAAGRAKDRAAKYSGREPEQFIYSSKTNRARVTRERG